MALPVCAAVVCLIACHGGPAGHFATFAETLATEKRTFEIYAASGPALDKFRERGIKVKTAFSLDALSFEQENALAEQIAKICSTASVVITDVGHAFAIKIQKALAELAPHVPRGCYYDNLENYVPGGPEGYSATAALVTSVAQFILFANGNHAHSSIYQARGEKMDFGMKKTIGVGYYPLHEAEKIAQLRASEQVLQLRENFFKKNQLKDNGQHILVYFGGNNDEYFTKAFPAFLSLLEESMMHTDLTNILFLLHQHPGAVKKNIDGHFVAQWMRIHGEMPQAPRIFLSHFALQDAKTLAHCALYNQTSMILELALAGIPMIQIGHDEEYEDILIKSKIISPVTKCKQLIDAIGNIDNQKEILLRDRIRILESAGIKENWREILESTIDGLI